jgi:hypothetical protein
MVLKWTFLRKIFRQLGKKTVYVDVTNQKLDNLYMASGHEVNLDTLQKMNIFSILPSLLAKG